MNRATIDRIVCRGVLFSVLAATATLATGISAVAAVNQMEPALKVGDQAPLFSVASSQDTLADYNRDYYGSHHLVLTFFPAAFTPV